MDRRQKPRWPYVVSPYLLPSHLMLWGVASNMVTSAIGLAGLAALCSFVTMAGLAAFIYAYRKQPPYRAAERKWWREFRARYRRA